MTPSSDNSSSASTGQKKFVELKVYVPCVEVNGRRLISYNGEIFGRAQHAIGYPLDVQQEDEQLYQDDFSGFPKSYRLNGNNDTVPQDDIQSEQTSAATLPDGNNDTKIFSRRYQHTAEFMPSFKPTTPKKRPIDPYSVQQLSQQSPTTTEPMRPKKRRISSPDTEQKKANHPSRPRDFEF
ncbi:unnamed protein product [Aureobasidium mustum]|uniref:Uncharacterized protein n=1 Tax=Aureobasidium mustum TaxID=2773714 RepID=A0A9N8K8D2_9PEZI|nr:unnamed protein product [Aureobasidium mustum]